MRNCRQCGRKVYGHNKTCPYCGTEMFGNVNSVQTNPARDSGDRKPHERPIGGSYSSWNPSPPETTRKTNSSARPSQANVVKSSVETMDNRAFHERPIGGSYSSWNSSQTEMTGVIHASQANVVKSGAEEKFHASRGHGFAAERANTLYDNMTFKNAKVIGDTNEANGADRFVNGVNIQSKYCATGKRCVDECFRNGEFRYYLKDNRGNYIRDSNGLRKPMQIEVPPNDGNDKIYDDAVKAMQKKIDEGQVDGVKDAKEIVRKGNVTYEQAKNIAKAGTVESLTYDAVEGIKIGAYSGGISAAVTFAVASWNGKSFEEALDAAVAAGLQTGGIAWASSVLVGQMTKAGVNSVLVPYTDAAVDMLGNKAASALANALREEGAGKIAGAAAKKYLSKFLRGNVVTGIATVAIMSAGDVVDIFRGRISASQLFKNVVNTSAGVAGGAGGWMSGAAAGAAVGGPVGAVIGGFLGGWLLSTAASKVSQTVTDEIIRDDAKDMAQILESVFPVVANEYILNESEVEQITGKLISGDDLKDMYASNSRKTFARDLLSKYAAQVVSKRKRIYLPSTQDYVRGLRRALE